MVGVHMRGGVSITQGCNDTLHGTEGKKEALFSAWPDLANKAKQGVNEE